MRNIVDNYVKKFKQEHRKSRRTVALLLALALVVTTGVSWQLHATGIALTNETYCGLTEHQHDESCYERVLVCDLQESEGTEGHTHTEDCYETQLVCGLEEHTHTVECMSNENADVETASDWKATLPDLSGDQADDVVAIAESQLGYTESTANFALADDGETRQGYTRYGAWYGNEYGDWDAMFASFCLYYAGVGEDDFPEASGAYAWSVELDKQDLYADAGDYTPAPGDLVFFDTDDDGKIDRVGIVEKLDTDTDDDGTETVTKLYVIEGDYAESAGGTDAVCEVEYRPDDETIVGFGTVSAVAEESNTDDTDAEPEETAAEAVTGSGDFTYEDENVTIQVHAEGDVSVPVSETETAGADEVSWDNVTMEVTVLDEESETYTLLSDYVDEMTEDSELSVLEAVSFSFYYDGEEIDAPDWELTADVTPVEQTETSVMAETDDDESDESDESGDEAAATAVTYTLLGTVDGEVTEADAATVSSDEEELPTLTVSLMSAKSVIALTASNDANPTFTVQYYANLDIVSTTGDATLDVIDTKGGILPKNGTTPATTTIGLTASGSSDLGTLYKVNTVKTLTEVYSADDYSYSESPGLDYFDKLKDSDGYTLSEIWVLTGTDETSTDEADWTVYTYTEGATSFTNTASAASDTVIYIADDAVIRLVYDTATSSYVNEANLYDYDISDGKAYSSASTSSGTTTNNGTNTVYAYTYMSGINSSDNYSGSGTKLAFGNDNTGTGLGGLTWSNALLNMYNSTGYKGCTFGLVQDLELTSTSSIIKYASGVSAANLFDDGEATGKTTYNDQSLTFEKDGDTYTLTTVSGEANVTDLDTFLNFSAYTNIFTNNFWPMDTVDSYGASGHDFKFGSYELRNLRKFFSESYSASNLPVSDDNTDHNSYFGMQYAVDFTLTADYVGPLNYYFFGDDDMWVFLTDSDGNSTLVCDIGGVHSSVGEYVDLRDYLPVGTSGTYTLTFFYTERGASGSTCYMRFTLPSVTSATTVQNTGSLKVEKEVDSKEATGNEPFTFKLNLKSSSGSTLTDTYNYTTYNSNGTQAGTGTITNNGTLTLKDGQYAIVSHLPVGTVCTVTETTTGYATSYTVGSGDSTYGTAASGTITNGGTTEIKFVNSTPDVEKEVKNSRGDWAEYNTAEIGETVEFKTTINDVEGVINLKLHDTLSAGLTDPEVKSVTVVDANGDWVADINDYTVTYYTGKNATPDAETTDDCSFEITFTQATLNGLTADNSIVVYYTATVTADAVIGNTGYSTEGGNPNETYISYGESSCSEIDTTITYTYEMNVYKYYSKKSLSGAEFILYVDSQKYALVDTTTGKITGWASDSTNATTLTSDSDGLISVKGLDAGTYYLEETKAPDGYTLLSDPIEIRVDANGTITYKVGSTEIDASTTNNQVQVENEPGYELPLTGGTGTYWYTMAGTLLIGGAAYLLYRNLRRRKGERQL